MFSVKPISPRYSSSKEMVSVCNITPDSKNPFFGVVFSNILITLSIKVFTSEGNFSFTVETFWVRKSSKFN